MINLRLNLTTERTSDTDKVNNASPVENIQPDIKGKIPKKCEVLMIIGRGHEKDDGSSFIQFCGQNNIDANVINCNKNQIKNSDVIKQLSPLLKEHTIIFLRVHGWYGNGTQERPRSQHIMSLGMGNDGQPKERILTKEFLKALRDITVTDENGLESKYKGLVNIISCGTGVLKETAETDPEIKALGPFTLWSGKEKLKADASYCAISAIVSYVREKKDGTETWIADPSLPGKILDIVSDSINREVTLIDNEKVIFLPGPKYHPYAQQKEMDPFRSYDKWQIHFIEAVRHNNKKRIRNMAEYPFLKNNIDITLFSKRGKQLDSYFKTVSMIKTHSALQYSSSLCCFASIEVLLEVGADPCLTTKDSKNENSLMLICKYDPDAEYLSKPDRQKLFNAVISMHGIMVKSTPDILTKKNSSGLTAIHLAARANNVPAIKALIQCSAMPFELSKNKKKPIDKATDIETISVLHLAECDFLLNAKKSDTEIQDANGNSRFMQLCAMSMEGTSSVAARQQSLTVIRGILKRVNPDLSIKNKKGETALTIALALKDYELAKILLRHMNAHGTKFSYGKNGPDNMINVISDPIEKQEFDYHIEFISRGLQDNITYFFKEMRSNEGKLISAIKYSLNFAVAEMSPVKIQEVMSFLKNIHDTAFKKRMEKEITEWFFLQNAAGSSIFHILGRNSDEKAAGTCDALFHLFKFLNKNPITTKSMRDMFIQEDEDGYSPLHCAIMSGNKKFISLFGEIIKEFPFQFHNSIVSHIPNKENAQKAGLTPLLMAVKSGDANIIDLLLNISLSKTLDSQKPAHFDAVVNRVIKRIEYLARKKIKGDELNDMKSGVLHLLKILNPDGGIPGLSSSYEKLFIAVKDHMDIFPREDAPISPDIAIAQNNSTYTAINLLCRLSMKFEDENINNAYDSFVAEANLHSAEAILRYLEQSDREFDTLRVTVQNETEQQRLTSGRLLIGSLRQHLARRKSDGHDY
jgi:ankyrin repeat protein